MDWNAALPALLGALVGGGLTIGAQYLSDSRAWKAAVQSEARTAKRAQIDKQREQILTLHGRVADDLAVIRDVVTKAEAGTDLQRVEILDPLKLTIWNRHDLAASLIAVVEDDAVRDAADAVYISWIAWVSHEVDAIANETRRPDRTEAHASGPELAKAVRAALAQLNEREAALS